MHAGGTRLLRQSGDQLLDLLADDHHHVGEFVDDHHDVRQRLQRVGGQVRHLRIRLKQRIEQGTASILGVLHLLVETGQIAHTDRSHQLVAALHLGNAPAQRVGRLHHVGHHRRQQMRDAVVDRQLEHLRVDHDHAHVLGAGLVQQAEHHRIDRHRLARAGGAGDQQMRHLAEIDHDGPAANILAQRQRQRGFLQIVFV
jgi:hypothetical protein